jgi:hypothetical protein
MKGPEITHLNETSNVYNFRCGIYLWNLKNNTVAAWKNKTSDSAEIR